MKSRKILIFSLVSVLLGGCGAKMENDGVVEFAKKEKTVTTVTTSVNPIIGEVETYDEDQEKEEPNVNYENEKEDDFSTTTITFVEPQTVIPTGTTNNWETSTTTSSNTSEYVKTSSNSSFGVQTTGLTTEQPRLETEKTFSYTEVTTEKIELQIVGIRELPDSIQSVVDYWKEIYPGMDIGVGIYTLDGLTGYEYNAYKTINSACSIKAAYAFYVMQSCELNGIDIWTETIQYLPRHKDDGTSVISDYGTYYEYYTIARLVELLLGESDNTAYTMLTDRFPVSGMYQIIAPIGGQSDWNKWGRASVSQRKNEWLAIYRYLNTGSTYANTLRQYLTNTNYCYLVQGMWGWHNYLHKSGWTEDSPEYPACCDAAIIDDSYLVVVMSQDYSTAIGHYDAIQGIGYAVEGFYNENGGNIF